MKTFLTSRIAEHILSEKVLLKKRAKFERERAKAGEDRCVEFFHDPSDPYSQLLQSVLPEFEARYNIRLETHLVCPPNDAAAPERAKLTEYARQDAMRLAKKAKAQFIYTPTAAATHTEAADKRREHLGHYLGGTLYYGGEWYWGLDRLHYLEARLTALGLRRSQASVAPIYNPPIAPEGQGQTNAEIDWYFSFRSPYSAISASRVKTLADAYGATLNLRFVLPMVMRGLPIPPAKKAYIPLDTAREARRLGVSFGRICDPVGAPVERGYSLLPWAQSHERGFAFVEAFFTEVWSCGTNAGSDRGMKKIVERAGLNWNEARSIIGNDDWRKPAEVNRAEMMDYGIWGVPSFRVGDSITWGQDRLWVVEHALQKHSAHIQ